MSPFSRDNKHIALEKARVMISLLRKSQIGQSEGEENSLLVQLKSLQQTLRFGSPESVDPLEVLSPFLALLRAQYLSGPFKLAALDAIQTFISCNVLCELPSRTGDALAEVVDAVTRCKFVQTDVVGDELVQLQIVQTLYAIIKNPVRIFLTDATTWDIIDAAYSILIQTGSKELSSSSSNNNGSVRSHLLYHTAERTLLDSVRFVFSSGNMIKFEDEEVSMMHNSEQQNVKILLSLAPSLSTATGLPCAMKVLGYFLGILQKHSNDNIGQALAKEKKLLKPLSSIGTPRGFVPLGESSLDPETLELLLSLKTIHAMLLSEGGNMTASRNLIIACRPLASMLKDDLGRCLVLLSSRRDFAPSVFQSVLSLFSTLLISIGPSIKVLIECFMKHVYLKSLHQLLNILIHHEEFINGGGDINTTSSNLNSSTESSSFSLEELEMILENLADLISDAGFLPSLFASFDCDPTKPDIIQPLIRYLSRCTRYYLTLPNKDLGHLVEVGKLCVNCYYQLCRTFSDRSGDGLKYESVNLNSDEYESTISKSKDIYVSNVSRHLKASRLSKKVLQEASNKFVIKPELGLRYLQDRGCLPTPLTPASVAKFLRIAPGLPKENAGAYLGELGKDSPNYESEGKEFHKLVLLSYVQSFELSGQTVLNCMRIFLSAFRLPGEAQQIDRILVAFSEYCHKSCIEGNEGQLENPEVTYLLTFSIIMLNTDRHNPNIKADRKMTIEQFIKNNTIYGSDVNQTIPLSREYLESIYKSISECPIRTERNDVSATITNEMWMDLQLQAEIDAVKGIFITTNYQPNLLVGLKNSYIFGSTSHLSFLDSPIVDTNKCKKTVESETEYASKVTLSLLTSNATYNPLEISSIIFESHCFLDSDMIGCIWHELLGVSMGPFIAYRLASNSYSGDGIPTDRPSSNQGDVRKIRVGIDVLLTLLKLSSAYLIRDVVDTVLLLLTELTGLLNGQSMEIVMESLELDFKFSSNPAISGKSKSDNTYSTFLENLFDSLPARAALGTLLQIIHNNPNYISESLWNILWHLLGTLRDCSLLPIEMVIEQDSSLLPAVVHAKFDSRLNAISKKRIVKNGVPPTPQNVKRNSSLLSFVFGNGNEVYDSNVSSGNNSVEFIQEDRSTRWDAGYETLREDTNSSQASKDNKSGEIYSARSIIKGENALSSSLHSVSMSQTSGFVDFMKIQIDGSSRTESNGAIEQSFESLRDLVSSCGIGQLIADTRFLGEKLLVSFFQSLINCIEMSDNSLSNNLKASKKTETSLVLEYVSVLNEDVKSTSSSWHGIKKLENIISQESGKLSLASPSSCAWMEMLLVEAVLRNRDRFSLIWPIIATHYTRCLSDAECLSYALERRVTGFFRIATRMISRDQMGSPFIDLLGALFTIPSRGSGIRSSSLQAEIMPISTGILADVAEQISSGMWRLLTLNVSALPALRLEHWQVIFDVIAVGASAGGFASIKSFEAMAWLLHEPRLRAEVPVFCIVGLKPLLCNLNAPVSVSVGAVHLLTHLHTRLEVLAKEDDGIEVQSSVDGDTPALWESCWTPILQALADGVADERLPVRTASVKALSHAILDKHVLAVPSGVLVNILGDVIVPTLLILGEILVSEEAKTKSCSSSSGKEEKTIASTKKTTGNLKESNDLRDINISLESSFIHPNENGSGGDSDSDISNSFSTTSDSVIELMDSLTNSFLQQLKKVSSYPSFDKLWLRLLHVLGFFLSAPDGVDMKLVSRSTALRQVTEDAEDKLHNMLVILIKQGIFKERTGLWCVTVESISQFGSCAGLIEKLSL